MIWYQIASILAVFIVAYWLGVTVEGHRWAENATMNGSRIFHCGESYKVRKLPDEMGRRDE